VVSLRSSVAFPYAPVGESYGTAHRRGQPHTHTKKDWLPALGPTVRLCRRIVPCVGANCAPLQARYGRSTWPRVTKACALGLLLL